MRDELPGLDDETEKPDVIKGSWLFRDPRNNQIVEIDVIVATPEAWVDQPESRDSYWLTRAFGSRLVSLHVLF